MNYEKAYKEALKRASKLRVQNPFDTISQMMEYLFPELKESEDKKIKNRLIKLIKMSSEVGGFALHKWEADEMVDWLEKQGQSFPILSNSSKTAKVWSEEDETVLNNLIYALANDRIGNDRDEYVSWLKSLKQRMSNEKEKD